MQIGLHQLCLLYRTHSQNTTAESTFELKNHTFVKRLTGEGHSLLWIISGYWGFGDIYSSVLIFTHPSQCLPAGLHYVFACLSYDINKHSKYVQEVKEKCKYHYPFQFAGVCSRVGFEVHDTFRYADLNYYA